jgi:PAS domain S-box-containing protein
MSAGELLRVIVVEDSEDDALLLTRAVAVTFPRLYWERVANGDEFRRALVHGPWHLIVSDHGMPNFSALEALRILNESGLAIPFIIVSGSIGEEQAVRAMKAGASDYILKSNLTRLVPAIERELRDAQGRQARRHAEQALTQSESRLRAVMEYVADAVLVFDDAGTIESVNHTAERLFGRSAAELVGAPIGEVLPSEVLGQAGAGAHEAVARRAGGAEFPIEVAVGTTRFDERPIFIATVRDMTERKQMQARMMLTDRLASVGTLAAGVAHEINNPLAYVIANLEFVNRGVMRLLQEARAAGELLDDPSRLAATLLSQIAGLESAREALDAAREGTDRVRHIVRDLKTFSRSDDVKRGPVDVRAVIESSLNMAWNEIRHRARLVKNYTEVERVDANASRLGQVFLNLIVNAAQAIPEGAVDKNEIRVAVTPGGADDVVVAVSDTGSGMTPEVQARIFDPFFTTKPVGVGTGLGLSICHSIVAELGGDITVASAPGRGTTFSVRLPVAARTAAQASAAGPKLPQTGRRGRILVVDDEPMVGKAVRRTLGEHDVTVLTGARAALELIAGGERYDIIFCDLMMPEMSGMDLYGELARDVPEQAERMIFMSGGAFTPRAQEFLDRVPNARVEKPFDWQGLRQLVSQSLR